MILRRNSVRRQSFRRTQSIRRCFDPKRPKMEFIDSIRGGKLLVFNDYIYRIDRKGHSEGHVYWKCRTKHCKSRLKVVNGELVKVFAEAHNHSLSVAEIEKLKTTNRLKKEIAKNPMRPVPEIYKEICGERDDQLDISYEENETETPNKKIKLHSIDSTLYRYRRKFLPQKNNPSSETVTNSDQSYSDELTGMVPQKTPNTENSTPKTYQAPPKPLPPCQKRSIQEPKTASITTILAGKWVAGKDGETFLVVNDRLKKKILAFVTPEFLDMLCPTDRTEITTNLMGSSQTEF